MNIIKIIFIFISLLLVLSINNIYSKEMQNKYLQYKEFDNLNERYNLNIKIYKEIIDRADFTGVLPLVFAKNNIFLYKDLKNKFLYICFKKDCLAQLNIENIKLQDKLYAKIQGYVFELFLIINK